ncbi:CinA family protein [Streptomyces evansiae]|uniref:CinA family protein n=1 Tax=Streptomyces evansiae TaxID=3075535 RepID=UPI002886E6C5|nr:CinA family protein [Streptomyces sp. DSM 41859]MDT0423902.1 CinA family protein [Streptomyces sp. DSM 41859]
MSARDAGGALPENAAVDVVALAREAGWTVAVAESLTGGLVAAELTAAPGASAAFRGSVTAYATELKHRLLGVDAALLAGEGAVHPEVAAQMATGARDALGADWGAATTGVAGPEPQDGRPVGTVYVAVAGPAGVRGPLPPGPEPAPGAVESFADRLGQHFAHHGTVEGETSVGDTSGAGDAGERSVTGLTGAQGEKILALRLNGDRTEIRRDSVRIVLGLLRDELITHARAQDTEEIGGT